MVSSVFLYPKTKSDRIYSFPQFLCKEREFPRGYIPALQSQQSSSFAAVHSYTESK